MPPSPPADLALAAPAPTDSPPTGRGAGVAVRTRSERWNTLAALFDETGSLAIERLRGARSRPAGPSTAADPAPPPVRTASPARVSVARSSLPRDLVGGLEQVQRLLNLEDPFLSSDPRGPEARQQLAELLSRTGREVLGEVELRFLAAEDPEEAPALDPALAEEARRDAGTIHYRPDLVRHPLRSLRAGAPRLGALAVVAVVTRRGESLGLLEITSPARDPFRDQDLALIALIADWFAGLMERTARVEKLVFVDPMTGVYNRVYFELQLENEMARSRRESSSMALCIVDIDDFKLFNSAFGYEGGNRVLIDVAHGLKGAVRPFDTVARWGGEEFAVVLSSPVQPHDVLAVCERLRALVDRLEIDVTGLDGKARRVRVTVSIGVALFPDHERNAHDLWRAANLALLEAKRGTKNQVVFYRPATQAR